MTVRVYVGDLLVEELDVDNEQQALDVAGEWQDRGFKVRIE